MKRRFLSGAMGRLKTLSPELRAALDELGKLGDQQPSLAGPAAAFREVLPEIIHESPPPAVSLTEQAAIAKLHSGTPMLHGESLSIDAQQFRWQWQTICIAMARHSSDPWAAGKLAKLPAEQKWNAGQLIRDVLRGDFSLIHSRADAAGLDPQFASAVLRLALFPVLTAAAAAMSPWRVGRRWPHGYCPTCGSWPLLAEFRGLEQTRHLRCGLCATEWEFPRLECPFCSMRDHNRLGYFHVEGEEARYRAATCDACRGYVKTVSTLSALSPVQLLVMDVATLHLDLAAADRGYSNDRGSETHQRRMAAGASEPLASQ